jgi:hypothetical protein
MKTIYELLAAHPFVSIFLYWFFSGAIKSYNTYRTEQDLRRLNRRTGHKIDLIKVGYHFILGFALLPIDVIKWIVVWPIILVMFCWEKIRDMRKRYSRRRGLYAVK